MNWFSWIEKKKAIQFHYFEKQKVNEIVLKLEKLFKRNTLLKEVVFSAGINYEF